jgi:DNA modification methylase
MLNGHRSSSSERPIRKSLGSGWLSADPLTPGTPPNNMLYFGDNLRWLRDPRAFPDGSIDLIYLDPPFNSNQVYNVVFSEKNGSASAAQVKAFADTWRWDDSAARTFQEVMEAAAKNPDYAGAALTLQVLDRLLGKGDLLAYLTMMTPRLVEMRRVLKPTGSIYLHCDPTASHYLKILLDSTFGLKNFRSEVVWRRKTAHNKLTRQYGPIHDTILFYTKSDEFTFHPGKRPYPRSYIEGRFKGRDDKGIYRQQSLTGAEIRHGQSGEVWRGFDPTAKGRHWAIPASLKELLPNSGFGMTLQQKLDYLADESGGAIEMPGGEGGMPTYKQYLGTGVPYQDIWSYQPGTRGTLYETEDGIDEDVAWLEDEDEKTGFQTQKPRGLLKRIIESSSDPGQTVLDPFCGCGSTIIAAEELGRRWIGIDVTHLAVALVRSQLQDAFGNGVKLEVHGLPEDMAGARALVGTDPTRYEFQWWALSLVGAAPVPEERKKGADAGVDGWLRFYEVEGGDLMSAPISVKSGKPKLSELRDLAGVVDREDAPFGGLILLEEPTRDMVEEAAKHGFYKPKVQHDLGKTESYPRIQIRTIEDLLQRKRGFDCPPMRAGPFKRTSRVERVAILKKSRTKRLTEPLPAPTAARPAASPPPAEREGDKDR